MKQKKPTYLTGFAFFKSALLVSMTWTLATSCGRSTGDVYRAYNLVSQRDLAAENRLALQSNSGLSYLYVPPAAEDLTSDESVVQAPKTLDSETVAETNVLPIASSPPKALPEVKATIPSSYRQAPAFELEDLKGQSQSFTFPLPRVTLMAFADQDGAKQMEAWITPLYQRYQSQIDIHGVAVLSMVPAFARGIARGIISTQVKQPIMLDWTGDVSRQFQTLPKVTHLFVLNPQGQILLEQSGSATAEKLATLAKAIDQALK